MRRLPAIGEGDLLIVTDLQNDFCAGGALAVPGADELVPVINRLAEAFAHVVLTQDWHPPGHLSFASSHPGRGPFETVQLACGEQILWPDHCVQNSHGAGFHADLAIPHAELILRKGYRAEVDSYSALYENDRCTPTGLTGYLRERGLRRLFLAGLATDFCVYYTALDARLAGFETVVLLDACRAIDRDGSLAAALAAMRAAGVEILG
ncbi:bifunctional nicotinamidase/pyrazinamidase [Azotobacter chroococcum]|uniref:Nicotinamidase n=1 Tax=Azotobacter chroococcum TaxID=353 RepID=A0AA43ZA38_9GAMM|nr:bifunctional nicotinamidase/pyrazinamidase [Azotobacter chroococcum]NHN79754.1 bifunctional nicotinamidase/pyrazinamidase [Azotobacter chroococcum]